MDRIIPRFARVVTMIQDPVVPVTLSCDANPKGQMLDAIDGVS